MWSLAQSGIELHCYVLGFHGIESIHTIFMTFSIKIPVTDLVLVSGMVSIHGLIILLPHISEAKFFVISLLQQRCCTALLES